MSTLRTSEVFYFILFINLSINLCTDKDNIKKVQCKFRIFYIDFCPEVNIVKI